MRRVIRFVGILVALVLVVAISLPFLISANRFKPILESKLSSALGRQVTIGNLGFSLLHGGVAADRVTIAEDPAFGTTPFVQAKSLIAGVEMWPLIFSRKLNVTRLTIEQPQVRLLQAPSGRWNYSSLGGGKPAQGEQPPSSPPAEGGEQGINITAKNVRIVDGRFLLGQTGGRRKPLVLDQVNLDIRSYSPTSASPFTLTARVAGGGDIKLEGTAGPIDTADMALTPFSATINVKQLNLASALAGTAPDIAGIASLNGQARSANGVLTTTGALKADKLKLAKNGSPAGRPVEVDFNVVDDLQKHTGTLPREIIRAGSAAASVTGTFAMRGETTDLNMKLDGRNMPIPDLAALLPALGIKLPAGSRIEGGVANAAFTLKGPADRLVTGGALQLNNTKLANFDLGSKMALVQQLAGIQSLRDTDIQTFSANLLVTPQGTSVQNIQFVAPAIGQMNGGGTISPSDALNFKMSATIKTSRSAALSQMAIPFFIEGTATNPVFRPDVQALAKSQSKAVIESELQKQLKGNTGQAVSNALDQLLGGKKKQQ